MIIATIGNRDYILSDIYDAQELMHILSRATAVRLDDVPGHGHVVVPAPKGMEYTLREVHAHVLDADALAHAHGNLQRALQAAAPIAAATAPPPSATYTPWERAR